MRRSRQDLWLAGDLSSDAGLPLDLKAQAEVVACVGGRIAGLAASFSAFRQFVFSAPPSGMNARAMSGAG